MDEVESVKWEFYGGEIRMKKGWFGGRERFNGKLMGELWDLRWIVEEEEMTKRMNSNICRG